MSFPNALDGLWLGMTHVELRQRRRGLRGWESPGCTMALVEKRDTGPVFHLTHRLDKQWRVVGWTVGYRDGQEPGRVLSACFGEPDGEGRCWGPDPRGVGLKAWAESSWLHLAEAEDPPEGLARRPALLPLVERHPELFRAPRAGGGWVSLPETLVATTTWRLNERSGMGHAWTCAVEGGKLANRGRLEQAVALYDLGFEMDPRHVACASNKAWACHRLGRLDEAIELLEGLLERDDVQGRQREVAEANLAAALRAKAPGGLDSEEI